MKITKLHNLIKNHPNSEELLKLYKEQLADDTYVIKQERIPKS